MTWEDSEELTMIALALKNVGIEDVTPERGVEILIERLTASPLETIAREVEAEAKTPQRPGADPAVD